MPRQGRTLIADLTDQEVETVDALKLVCHAWSRSDLTRMAYFTLAEEMGVTLPDGIFNRRPLGRPTTRRA